MKLYLFIYRLEEWYKLHPKFFRKQSNKTFSRKICGRIRGSYRSSCHKCTVDQEFYNGSRVPYDGCYKMANEVLERIIRKIKLKKLLS